MPHHYLASLRVALLALALVASSCSHSPDGPHYNPFSTANSCIDSSEISGDLSIQRIRSRDGRCVIIVKRSDSHGGWYRNYQISSTGMIMVFNSFGNSPRQPNSGSRNFFLFPRMTAPDYKIDSSGTIEVKTAADETIRFSPKTQQITDISGDLRFEENAKISRWNEGGLVLHSYPRGIILDTGWQAGGQGHEHLWRHSTFIDGSGGKCRIKNKEIFYRKRGEPYLRFDNDIKLLEFLEKRCPQLDLEEFKDRLD